MSRTNFDQLLEAGCHFGHLRRKWNPAMAPYIFMERNGIHIIDLHKTVAKVDEAAEALKQIAKSGKKILFVATKKQAKDIVAEKAASVNMPYVIERWPGGMLTNFPTIRKAVKKMANIDKQGVMHSRIRPTLVEGSIVTDTRANTHYVVTEYGMVNLKGLSSWQKAEALISVAHPDFRDELIAEAEKMHIWRRSNK